MIPTPWSDFVFALKAWGLRAQRWLQPTPPRHPKAPATAGPITESRSILYTLEADEESAYQLGKIQNLRVAAQRLDGILIPAGQLFSFWRHVGRPTTRAGFVRGRMLRQGCLLPSVGGGLCQLSNALYQVALEAGCDIVERHAHSRIVPGSAAELGKDATVAWNYIDLRFRPRSTVQLSVKLTADELVVRLQGGATAAATPQLPILNQIQRLAKPPNSCFTCGQDACAHHTRAAAMKLTRTRTAFLVDENWPEFRTFVSAEGGPQDALFLPINGERFRLPRYRWPLLNEVHEARWATARRSWRSRRLASQGAARQLVLLQSAEELASAYASALTPSMTQLVVAQSLLPFLWRSGALGGRTFRVLMTRFSIQEIERRLDAAFHQHPSRATLNDFRAPAWIAEAESEALAAAREIITPHAGICAPNKRLLNWELPPPTPPATTTTPRTNALAFAGPVVARRGAYEVRDAARATGLPVLWSGANFEGPDFWHGIDARQVPQSELNTAAVLLAPAVVESRPQAALAALAAGVPVIATAATGLDPAAVHLISSPAELLATMRTVCR